MEHVNTACMGNLALQFQNGGTKLWCQVIKHKYKVESLQEYHMGIAAQICGATLLMLGVRSMRMEHGVSAMLKR